MTNINIYDTAHQLERDLRQLPAFQNLKEALAAIQQDAEAKELYEAFQQATQKLQFSQEEPSEKMMEDLQALYGKVTENPILKKLMENEQQLSLMMEEINQIIAEPLQEIYQMPSN